MCLTALHAAAPWWRYDDMIMTHVNTVSVYLLSSEGDLDIGVNEDCPVRDF